MRENGDEASVSPSVGEFIRKQRQLADLSLRQMAELTQVSNAYLSQIERGLHASLTTRNLRFSRRPICNPSKGAGCCGGWRPRNDRIGHTPVPHLLCRT